MNILLALIAFSVVMIVLSTLVVAIVQLIHQARGVRQRHMKYFVGAIFDEYLWPSFGKLTDDAAGQVMRASDTKNVMQELRGRTLLQRLSGALDLLRFWSPTPPPKSGFRSGGYRLFGVLVWLVLIATALVSFVWGGLIPLVILALALLWFVDRHRESGREAFPLFEEIARFHSGNKAQIAADFKDLEEAENSGKPPEDGRLAELYRKAKMRRRFVEEMVKFSKSMAADAGRDRSASVDKLTVTDFASQLARTEFGEAIRIATKDKDKDKDKDKLEVVLTEMARRFDQTGQESTANFRETARKWSVAVAFILAVGANVDAIRLLETFYRDPDLAQKVDAKYQGQLEVMSQRLEAAAKLAENTGEPKEVASAEAEIEDLQRKLKDLRGNVKEDVEGLAALGVPIGWNYFPYCVPKEVSDPTASGGDKTLIIFQDEACRKIVMRAKVAGAMDVTFAD
ncbi:MAG: hypothetical protein AAFR21_18260 [Pseudomonadota bacterium]